MQVIYSKRARKDMQKIPAKDRAALAAKLQTYAETGEGDVKKLQARPGYRLRHGTWRAIFEVSNNVLVVRAGHRKDIYE